MAAPQKKRHRQAPKSIGTVEYRGASQWRAKITLPDGTRPAKTFDTKATAQAWIAELNAAAKRPDRIEIAQAAWNLTLADAMTERLQIAPPKKTANEEASKVARLTRNHPELGRVNTNCAVIDRM